MTNIIPDVRALLIENLTTSAARLGGLPVSVAWRWAQACSIQILDAKYYDHNRLEQFCFDDLAVGIVWQRDKFFAFV